MQFNEMLQQLKEHGINYHDDMEEAALAAMAEDGKQPPPAPLGILAKALGMSSAQRKPPGRKRRRRK